MHLVGIEAAGNTVSRTARYLIRSATLVAFGAVGFISLTGCGNNYRPVVAAINPVGPSEQPAKYAVAISSPSPTLPGLVTMVNFSGDTVQITANVGASPQYLVLGSGGTVGYTINGDGTLNSFQITTTLITSQILQTTLLSNPPAQPVSIFPQGTNTYVTEPGRNAIAEFQSSTVSSSTAGAPLVLKQEFTVINPIYVVGLNGAPRVYALSQGDGTPANPPLAVAIDTTSNTPTASLPLGLQPVYGVMTADGRRAFVMNKGSNTVSVINAQTNQLDAIPGSTPAAPINTIPVGVNPIWADFAPPLSEMVVANAGNGTGNGSLSIISIPLCSVTATGGNVLCDANNPIDANGFGTVLANVAVGVNPVMVAALQDGSAAYVANAGNANTQGSVSVVNLQTNTVITTIPLSCHPSYIAATTGAPTGKVYVVCNDSKNMTVINTDINTISNIIPLQGNGVSVRVTVP